MGGYDSLLDTDKKKVIDSVEQEYLAYLFLNNSNAKMHSCPKHVGSFGYSTGFLMRKSVRSDIDSVRKL